MQPEAKTVAQPHTTKESSVQKMGVLAVEILSWPILLTLRLLIVKRDLHRDKASLNLKKNGNQARYVLYANHQSKYDPFLITACLPTGTIRRLLPFRFFVNNSYLKGSTKALIYGMGGFPAYYEENRVYGLDRAKALLKSRQTVVIFPPGRRTRERIAKRGISELAIDSNVYVIPFHINWKSRWHCQVYIGAPIKGGKMQSPDELMQQVYQLSE